MIKGLQTVLDWSEAWAPLIPLAIYWRFQPHVVYLKPVVYYLHLALIINLTGNLLGDYGKVWGFPEWLQRNTFLYNVHSIVRFGCFTSFFIVLNQSFFSKAKKRIPLLLLPVTVVYFWLFEPFNNPNHISAYFLAAESFLLLLYCMQYYLFKLNNDTELQKREADFWVATGLSIYVVINFFIFLFYIPVLDRDDDLADRLWNLHNIAYIMLCIFLAKAFYAARRR